MIEQLSQENVNQVNNNQDIISIDQLVNQTNQQQVVTQVAPEQVPEQQVVTPAQVQQQTSVVQQAVPKKRDKILTIQITLIIVWAILTALVYFFGYSLFEPFIKV